MMLRSWIVGLAGGIAAVGCGAQAQETVINQSLLGANQLNQQNTISTTSSGVTAYAGAGQSAGATLNQIGDGITFFQGGGGPLVITQGIGDTRSASSFALSTNNSILSSSSSPFGFSGLAAPQASVNQGNVVNVGIASGGTLSLSQTSAPSTASSSISTNNMSAFGAGGSSIGSLFGTIPNYQQSLSNLNAATLNIGGGVRVTLDQSGSGAMGVSSTNTATSGTVSGSAMLGTPTTGYATASAPLTGSAGGIVVSSGTVTASAAAIPAGASSGSISLGGAPAGSSGTITVTTTQSPGQAWLSNFLGGNPLAAVHPSSTTWTLTFGSATPAR